MSEKYHNEFWLNEKAARELNGNDLGNYNYIVKAGKSEILDSSIDELKNAILKIVNKKVEVVNCKNYKKSMNGKYLLVGLISLSEEIRDCLGNDKKRIKKEGFIIKSVYDQKIIIAANDYSGVLYGVFHFLRNLNMSNDLNNINILSNPKNTLRLINHWDNLDGSIERGYAGKSLFYSNGNILSVDDRIKIYIRLLASVGINGIVLNNVNVLDNGLFLTEEFILKLSVLADEFRKYSIKVYFSINFASPMDVGNLNTSNPTDKNVINWWKKVFFNIYKYIPDFGGVLIKADSEFRPGPHTYNLNHAEGANMFGRILKKYSGIVIWRCFVYNCQQDWRNKSIDRAKAAYDNFKPLDGIFVDNVILQIKNGPMDFQVREPVSPLFGALTKTNQILEFQITQEYTGQQKHICYLIPQWKEILDFDTFLSEENSKIKDIISCENLNNKYNGMAGVSNVGDSKFLTGHPLAQANLYGFGRLSWNADLTTERITLEWIKQTFGNDNKVVENIYKVLINSWKTYENYTSPLGIGWMINPNHHYGPNVDGYEYSKWGTYHRADSLGIGVNRTTKGTGFTEQYSKINCEMYNSIDDCPEKLLLFFHYVPYNFKLKSGVTLIQYIYDSHFRGVEEVKLLKKLWEELYETIDEDIFKEVKRRIYVQLEDSKEWRDVINSYFYRKSGINDIKMRKIY